jgi:hypothetical protein
MKVQEALSQFYSQRGFGEDGGRYARTVMVYAGPWCVRLPNPPARKRLLPFHDIHHLVTGYDTDRLGEAQLCAWEIGTGSHREPAAFLMNLAGLFTGLLCGPRLVYAAFARGCASKNAYGGKLEQDLLHMPVEELRRKLLGQRQKRPPLLAFRFGFCVLCATILGLALIALAGLQLLYRRLGGVRWRGRGRTRPRKRPENSPVAATISQTAV